MHSKNYGYILMLLISISCSPLSAQKWVNLNNRWTISSSCSGGGLGLGTYTYATFFKDSTLFNNQFYYQRFISIDSLFKIVTPLNQFYREKNGIVYLLNASDSTEEIIYNFNLNKGDSIVYNIFSSFKIVFKIIFVDNIVLANGEKRKRWTLQNKMDPNYPYIRHWIEGIGAAEVATFNPKLMYVSDCLPVLDCYFSKNQYLFGQKKECPNILGQQQGPVSTRDIATLASFQLIQNTGDGNIRFNLDTPGRYRCQVFDAMGRLLQSPPVSQGVNHVSLTDAPKGIYIIHIYDLENQQQMGLKVVRQ